MNRLLSLAVVIALGAGAAQAKATYCQDLTTHKRISCKTAPVTAAPATMAPAAAAPAKKPSMFSGLMKPKPATTSDAVALSASSSAAMATGGAPHCTKGKVCGHSCIAMAKVCHKP